MVAAISRSRRGKFTVEGNPVSWAAVIWFFRRKARIVFLALVIYAALC
jgi:hypothetical protein